MIALRLSPVQINDAMLLWARRGRRILTWMSKIARELARVMEDAVTLAMDLLQALAEDPLVPPGIGWQRVGISGGCGRRQRRVVDGDTLASPV